MFPRLPPSRRVTEQDSDPFETASLQQERRPQDTGTSAVAPLPPRSQRGAAALQRFAVAGEDGYAGDAESGTTRRPPRKPKKRNTVHAPRNVPASAKSSESDEGTQVLPVQAQRKKPRPIAVDPEELDDAMSLYRPAPYEAEQIAWAESRAMEILGKKWADISSADIEARLDSFVRRVRPSAGENELDNLYREYASQSFWIDIAISEKILDEEQRQRCVGKVYHLNSKFSQE